MKGRRVIPLLLSGLLAACSTSSGTPGPFAAYPYAAYNRDLRYMPQRRFVSAELPSAPPVITKDTPPPPSPPKPDSVLDDVAEAVPVAGAGFVAGKLVGNSTKAAGTAAAGPGAVEAGTAAGGAAATEEGAAVGLMARMRANPVLRAMVGLGGEEAAGATAAGVAARFIFRGVIIPAAAGAIVYELVKSN